MFESLKRTHRFARMSSLWIRVTNLDVGDDGQIARVASRRMVDDGLEPEDAWVSTLVAWTVGIPWLEDQRRVAECIVRFAVDPRAAQVVPVDVLDNARYAALELLRQLAKNDDSGNF